MYTTVTKVQNYALVTIDDGFTSTVEEWIEEVTEHIKNVTNRDFEASEAEKVFDGNRRTYLTVGDFTSLTTVKIDDTDVTDDILTYPANDTPKNTLYYENGFDEGKQNVKVTATWGYSDSVPSPIEKVATIMVAGIIQKEYKSEGAIKSEKIGNYQVSYSDNQLQDAHSIDKILSTYRKYPI